MEHSIIWSFFKFRTTSVTSRLSCIPAVSTLLGLVTVMNQHIVETAPPARRPRGSGLPTPAPQPEQDESFPWALCVSVMKEVEVLTEMAAETYLGKDQKWAPVASIEAIK